MKKLISIIFYFIAFCLPTQGTGNNSLNICTSNILYDNTSVPEQAWSVRKDITLNFYNTYKFDIIAMQEVSQTQLADFKQWTDYGYVGQGVNGGALGLSNLIFFKSDRLELLETGTFWLSPTPEQVSVGWDADQRRNCNWAKLKDKQSGKIFYYFNVHFDHIGETAQLQSAYLIRDTIAVIAKGYPAILSGDLNVREIDRPILVLKDRFIDPRDVTLTPPQGPYGTGHGMRIDAAIRRIDWIFLDNGNGRNYMVIDEYEVIDKTYDGKCISDHWPVRIKARIEDGKATFRVTSSLDDGNTASLRYIVEHALSGDSIIIDPSVNVISLSNPLNIDKSLNINGNATTIQVAMPGTSTYRALNLGSTNIAVSDTIRLYDWIIKGGNCSDNGAVALVNRNMKLYADKVTFRDGKAVYSGGIHIDVANDTEAYFNKCSFINNQSSNNAGAMYAKGKLDMNACLFEDNRTQSNGSALVSNATASIKNCIFRNNIASGSGDYGAALFNTGATGIALLENCYFEGNTATDPTKGAGAFGCSGEAKTTFVNCTFTKNQGAMASTLYNRSGQVAFINCTIAGNTATTATAGALHLYDVNTASSNLVNTVWAYNYNNTGKCDLSAGTNAVINGAYNIVSAANGVGTFTESVPFSYGASPENDSPLFKQYSFNSLSLKIPNSSDNGGQTPTIPLSEGSLACQRGITSLTGYSIPTVDGREYERSASPCLGAYELSDCGLPENLAASEITSSEVILSWTGNNDMYVVEYKHEKAAGWNRKEVVGKNISLMDLHSLYKYNWRVRSSCNQDWVAGTDFQTTFGLTVKSKADDYTSETLRYIIENAKSGDVITIAENIDTIQLTSPIEIYKNLRIDGNGCVIEMINPSSGSRMFKFGNGTTAANIQLNNMVLRGGKDIDGGVGIIYRNVTFSADRVTFRDGVATGNSGAIHCNETTGIKVQLTNCSFINNMAQGNAGAFYAKGKVTISNSLFRDNKTNTNGSAIANLNELTISNSLFIDNAAQGSGAYGSAVFNSGSATNAVFENCTFESNKSSGPTGCGAYGCSGIATAKFTNCTFWGNSGLTAGAIHHRSGKTAFINCTLAGNTTTSANSAFFIANDSNNEINFINTIVVYNYNNSGICDIYREGTNGIIAGSNNIIGTEKGTGSFGYVNTVSFNYTDSKLFQKYTTTGGKKIPVLDKTPELLPVILLEEESVAYQTGINSFNGFAIPSTDQRGAVRANPPCIGAYELGGSSSVAMLEKKQLFVYPNPAKDFLYIQSNKPIESLEIISLTGQSLKKIQQPASVFSVEDLPSGIYLLQVYTADKKDNLKIKISK